MMRQCPLALSTALGHPWHNMSEDNGRHINRLDVREFEVCGCFIAFNFCFDTSLDPHGTPACKQALSDDMAPCECCYDGRRVEPRPRIEDPAPRAISAFRKIELTTSREFCSSQTGFSTHRMDVAGGPLHDICVYLPSELPSASILLTLSHTQVSTVPATTGTRVGIASAQDPHDIGRAIPAGACAI